MLTPGQVAHFETFGFVVLREVFAPDEVSIMKRETEEIYAEYWNGGPATETTQFVQPFFDSSLICRRWWTTTGSTRSASTCWGRDFILVQTEGRARATDTSWHGPRPAEHELRTAKINFYLDELTKDTGALRFVPGSHRPADPDLYDLLRENNDDPDFRPSA